MSTPNWLSTSLRPIALLGLGASALLSGCKTADPPADMSTPDPAVASCKYEAAPVPAAGAGVGQLIAAGPVRAGVGEVRLDLPVGTPLGGYTARMRLLGGEAPDSRQSPHARAFYPSAGVQTRPQVRALYLQAGSEPLLVLKADLCLSYDRLVFDVEKTLAGEGLLAPRGHVMVATSHTHAGPGNYHGAFHLTLGLDMFDEGQYQRLLASLLTAARAAIQSAAPARIGVGVWDGWDKNDEIYSDRRDDDDGFLGPDGKPVGKHKEQRLFVLRVDKADGKPLAIVESFPIHGTVAGDDNPLISVEAPGHVELALEDRFSSPVLVMHLQGPAGDASPRGSGGLGHCDGAKALCADFARMESIGELAAPRILSLWSAIQTTDQATLEMVTRTVYNGRNITVRGGMAYAPFEAGREIDGSAAGIYTPDGKVRSPITQFNVEAGAGLCGSKAPMLPVDGIPGAKGAPFGSCADIGAAVKFISSIVATPAPEEGVPTCETTRATLSALRLDGVPVRRLDGGGNPVGGADPSSLLLVTLPGEPVSLLADALRARAPAPATADNTFIVGYTQGHVGYLLGVENWLAGGYEPSINLFGPLEGEWLMERSLDIAKLAMSPERDDPEAAAPGGARFDRLVYRTVPPSQIPRSPAMQAGQVPSPLPAGVLFRTRSTPPPSAQPPATIPRVTGRATFAFYGGDPEDDLPEVTLEFESTPGTFSPALLPSGRFIGSRGRDVLLTYSPIPVAAAPGKAQGHLWAAEWQAVSSDRSQGLAGALALPLGRYRFAVRGQAAGKSYQLQSSPFSVVADAAVTVSATRSGTQVSGTAVYAVGSGFRLLRLSGDSDGDVALSGMVSVKVQSKKSGATNSQMVSVTDGKFTADTTGLDGSTGFTVLVEDAAHNRGQIDVL